MSDHPLVQLPTRSTPQPSPGILPGGDCAYCCLSGIMGISVLEAYEHVDKLRKEEGQTRLGKDRNSLSNHCFSIVAEYWNEEIRSDRRYRQAAEIFAVPELMNVHPMRQMYGAPSWEMSSTWFESVYATLDRKYVLMASIDFEGKGPRKHSCGGTNHAVLIVGAYTKLRAHEKVPGAYHVDQMLQISCSVRGLWEIETYDFLFDYGGFNCVPFLLRG